jgi:hypothetical protein
LINCQTPNQMNRIPLLPLFFLFLCSCAAPRVVTEIVPETSEGHFAMGREYIPLESDQIAVELGFDGMQGENLVFDLVVHNNTSDTLTILPGDFYYVVLDSANALPLPNTPWMSVHPDKVLMLYDQTLEERKKEKSVNTVLGIIQASVNILYNASGIIATDNPGYIADVLVQTAGTADQYISHDRMISSELAMISEEKEVVEEEIFRASRVPPGSVISGFVYFPEHNTAAYYMFCFPVENQLFQFVYNQRKSIVYD